MTGSGAGRRLPRLGATLVALLARHEPMVLLVVAAAGLRALAWRALTPATWFSGDSFSYVAAAVHPAPGLWRPSGYSLLLLLPLRPAHSLALVTAVQHLLGLGVGVAGYALLLRLGVPRWAATLAAVPVLADAFLVSAEQMLLSEDVFTPLVVAAAVLLLWRPGRPALAAAAVGGLLLGLAGVTRTAGLPLVAVAAALLLARRAGLARLAVLLAGAALPVGLYLAWFHHDYHRWAASASGGLFLYGRVSQFADCDRLVDLDPTVRALCPAEPRGHRRPETYYVFDPSSPVQRLDGPMTRRNDLAGRFARQAILEQPGDYLAGCWRRLAALFSAEPGPGNRQYELAARVFVPPPARPAVRAYQHGSGNTRPDPRGVRALLAYQRYAWTPGPACLVALGLALVGMVCGRDSGRRGLRGGVWLLAGSAGVLYLVPAMTVGPDVRYRFPTVPLLATAATLGLVLLAGRVAALLRRRPAAVPVRPGPAGAPAVRPAGAGADPLGLAATRPDLPSVTTRMDPPPRPPSRPQPPVPPDRSDRSDRPDRPDRLHRPDPPDPPDPDDRGNPPGPTGTSDTD